MTLQNKVKQLLEDIPDARERRFRDRAVWAMLKRNHPTLEMMRKEDFMMYFTEIMSINRLILWVQQHYPELRGKDYPDKDNLEQEKKLELGYMPGYHEVTKLVNNLTIRKNS